jgi:hypothetical protein
MTYNGKNLFVLFYKMRAWLRAMSNSNHISQILLQKLFGAREEGNLSMDESRTDNISQVSEEKNALLTA